MPIGLGKGFPSFLKKKKGWTRNDDEGEMGAKAEWECLNLSPSYWGKMFKKVSNQRKRKSRKKVEGLQAKLRGHQNISRKQPENLEEKNEKIERPSTLTKVQTENQMQLGRRKTRRKKRGDWGARGKRDGTRRGGETERMIGTEEKN